MSRRILIHIGCSKTGTSSLQAGLWQSVDALAEAGVGLPFVDREAHLRGLVKPLGWRPVEGYGGQRDEAALADLSARLADTAGDVLLVSNEDLADLDLRGAETVAAACVEADLELHLIVTIRGWAQQLPSEFQQFVKHRMTLSYPDFLDAVSPSGATPSSDAAIWAGRFARRQDPQLVLSGWEALVPAERIHVVPISGADQDAIFDITASLLGVDSAVIARPGRSVNSSFGAAETEVFRRVSLALAATGSLPEYRDFARAVRRPFVRGVLPQGTGIRLRLPPEHRDWVAAKSEDAIAALAAAGYQVHGDLESLRPTDEQVADLPQISEGEIADIAVQTLARLAAHQHRRSVRAGQTEQALQSAASNTKQRWWSR